MILQFEYGVFRTKDKLFVLTMRKKEELEELIGQMMVRKLYLEMTELKFVCSTVN